ncbi:MAG: APC family permease [Alphaproteobacteria bacterium]|nr:APC family permease [Alphaproteobacteria bacterium]
MTLERPPRVIGARTGLAVVAGSMLGVGIFLAPPVMAGVVSGPLYWGIWVGAGLAALSGAAAYAELGALRPRAGGDFVFIREAFGPHAAFAAGQLMFAGAFAGSIAAMSVALCRWQIPPLLASIGILGDPSAEILGPLTGPRLGAVALILGFTGLNVAGARLSARAQAAMTLVPVLLMTALALWALLRGDGPGAAPARAFSPGGLSEAWLAAYFAYAGWPALVYVAGEVRDPPRTLPWSLAGGSALILALYLLLNAAMLRSLGWQGLAGAGEAGTAMAGALGGPRLQLGMTALIASAILASINGTVLGGGRVAQAMAEAGAMPQGLAALHPRARTPARALWLQAAVACVLALSGSFTQVLSLTSVAMMGVGGLTVLSLYRLRRLDPSPRPYAATGYPWSPLVYLGTSALAVGLTAWEAWSVGTWEAAWPLLGVALGALAWVGHRASR